MDSWADLQITFGIPGTTYVTDAMELPRLPPHLLRAEHAYINTLIEREFIHAPNQFYNIAIPYLFDTCRLHEARVRHPHFPILKLLRHIILRG
jgi:hypothetical protein